MIKKISKAMTKVALLLTVTMISAGCAEPGEEGDTEDHNLDCGDFGHAHDGHCHCDPGYLFDGVTCTTADQITEACEEDAHNACRCPAVGACPCDHGEIETHGAEDYCVPDLH